MPILDSCNSRPTSTMLEKPKLRPIDPDGLVLEAWGQGLMVGSLLVMAAVTVANMKRHVLLHKLIFAEVGYSRLVYSFPFADVHKLAYQLLAAMPHGTFIFPHSPAYEWYLCITVIGLIVSWNLHNIVAWMEIKPFLSRKVSMCYISTIILIQPYWVVEVYANFAYFRNQNTIYETTRPMEPLFR